MGAEGFGGWLRIWVPLIKLEGNCGGRGVWGLITKVVYVSQKKTHYSSRAFFWSWLE